MRRSAIRLVVLGGLFALGFVGMLRPQTSTNLGVRAASYYQAAFASDSAPPATSSQQPASPAHVDLSKPVFTRAGAILCPLDAFNDPLEGHATEDLMQMFADPQNRQLHAAMQGCDVYQPHIQLSIANAQQRKDLVEDAEAYHAERIIAVLRDPKFLLAYVLNGHLEFLVTRMDEVTNTD